VDDAVVDILIGDVSSFCSGSAAIDVRHAYH